MLLFGRPETLCCPSFWPLPRGLPAHLAFSVHYSMANSCWSPKNLVGRSKPNLVTTQSCLGTPPVLKDCLGLAIADTALIKEKRESQGIWMGNMQKKMFWVSDRENWNEFGCGRKTHSKGNKLHILVSTAAALDLIKTWLIPAQLDLSKPSRVLAIKTPIFSLCYCELKCINHKGYAYVVCKWILQLIVVGRFLPCILEHIV